MSKLDIIIGPMFSGKTSYLLNKINEIKLNNNLNFIVLKPDIDSRFEYNKITSHNNISFDCFTCSNLNNFNPFEYDIILIDEGQFFNNLKDIIVNWLNNYDIHIIIAGLDGDYKQNKLGEILDLIPFSDSCIKLNAKCFYCSNKAPFTHKIIKNNDVVFIGGNESYVSLCRIHYKIYNL